jgi:hypothetical protein
MSDALTEAQDLNREEAIGLFLPDMTLSCAIEIRRASQNGEKTITREKLTERQEKATNQFAYFLYGQEPKPWGDRSPYEKEFDSLERFLTRMTEGCLGRNPQPDMHAYLNHARTCDDCGNLVKLYDLDEIQSSIEKVIPLAPRGTLDFTNAALHAAMRIRRSVTGMRIRNQESMRSLILNQGYSYTPVT